MAYSQNGFILLLPITSIILTIIRMIIVVVIVMFVRTVRINGHSYNFLYHFSVNPSGSLIPRVYIIIILLLFHSILLHDSFFHEDCPVRSLL